MAHMANPYRGSEFGFPKEIPAQLPATGFEGWLLQEGYPVELLVPPPGFPEGTPFFCSVFDSTAVNSFTHPDSPNYRDPYDPAINAVQFAPEPVQVETPDIVYNTDEWT